MDRTSAAASSLVLAAVFLLSSLAAVPHPAAAQVGTSSLAGGVCSIDQNVVYIKAPDPGDTGGCGIPLAGATLRLTKPGVGGTAVGAVDATAKSDGNGTYQFGTLADGDYSLAVAHAGYTSVTLNVKVAGATVRNVGLRPEAITVNGKVVDSAGSPVAGAHVLVCCGPTVGNTDATADAGGAFAVKTESGERTFTVERDGRMVLSQSQFVDGTQPVTLAVPPTPRPDAVLHGTVTDQDGNPLAGLTINTYSNPGCCPYPYAYADSSTASGTATASPGSGSASSGTAPAMRPYYPYYVDGSNSTTTDSAGRYSLRVFGGSGVSVNAYREGYASYSKYLQIKQGENHLLDIHLLKFPAKTAHLEGKVVDAGSGKGLRFVSISVQSPAYGLYECSEEAGDGGSGSGSSAPIPPMTGQTGPPTSDGKSVTQSEPTYSDVAPGYSSGCAITVRADGSFSGNVTPGYAIVQVYYDSYRACPPPSDGSYQSCAPEYYGWTQSLQLGAGKTTPLNVRLEQRPAPDAVVSGYLLDADTGKPLPGGQVSFSSEDGYGYGFATTDQDGSYRIKIRSGHLDVYASAEGHLHWMGTLTVESGETPLDLKLVPGEESGGGGIAYAKGADMPPGMAMGGGNGVAVAQSSGAATGTHDSGNTASAAFEDLHGGLGPYDAAARSKALANASGHSSPGAGLLLMVTLIGCVAWMRRRVA